MKFILASKSPRRKEILETIGLRFDVVTSYADESYDPSASPYEIVQALAEKKAIAVRDLLIGGGRNLSDTLIIAADTIVYCSGEILGKPHNKENSIKMLNSLNGKRHSVLSGISVIYRDEVKSSYDETFVKFARMTDTEIERYAESGEPYDKAGAYAVQGYASMWVEGIEGCYFNVVGLPVNKLRELIGEFGIELSQYAMKK